MRRGARPAAEALLLLVAVAALALPAARAAPGGEPARASAAVRPGTVRLGERVTYSGTVIVPPEVSVRFVLPAPGGDWTWGAPRAWRRAGQSGSLSHAEGLAPDTFHVEIPLQAFAVGRLSVPGLEFELRRSAGGAPSRGRLPVVALAVAPVVPAADSAADLRPMRGPLGAPWWERVPWLSWVGVALLVVAVVLAWRWLARRRRPALAAPVAAADADPMVRALAELEALRRMKLPEQGRFGEHAFHLTRIARQFLEGAVGATRPGDTTAELVQRLSDSTLPGGELAALSDRLRALDLVKFARAPSTVGAAREGENWVEALVRRPRAAADGAGQQVA